MAAGLAASIPADTWATTKRQLRRAAVERAGRWGAEESAEVAALWSRRAVDGWTKAYLAAATGKG
jgi:hypothetical protein